MPPSTTIRSEKGAFNSPSRPLLDTLSWGEPMLTTKSALTVAGTVWVLSVAVSVIGKLPASVGVPLIRSSPVNDNPVGNRPALNTTL